jgi:hypothetical protein
LGNKPNLKIIPPTPGCQICDGSCWEQILCKQYYWGCTKKGNYWGDWIAPGTKVFFVFRQNNRPQKPNTLYTLWAKTKVLKIGNYIDSSGVKGKDGYNVMELIPFMPAPIFKQNLTAKFVVDAPWGSSNYRYIDSQIETVLDSLI